MQPEYASVGVTLALGRTSESLYTGPLRGAEVQSGVSTHSRTTRVPCTWRGTRGEIPSMPHPRISQSRKIILHGILLQNPPDSLLAPSSLPPRAGPSISRDNIVHCRNGGIKHRSGETLNTPARFIARWIAARGAARSSEVPWDTGGRYAQLFRKLFYVDATLFVPLFPL